MSKELESIPILWKQKTSWKRGSKVKASNPSETAPEIILIGEFGTDLSGGVGIQGHIYIYRLIVHTLNTMRHRGDIGDTKETFVMLGKQTGCQDKMALAMPRENVLPSKHGRYL